jgi:hypothetical protein
MQPIFRATRQRPATANAIARVFSRDLSGMPLASPREDRDSGRSNFSSYIMMSRYGRAEN